MDIPDAPWIQRAERTGDPWPKQPEEDDYDDVDTEID